MSANNPFIEDIERQRSRRTRPSCFKALIPPVCTVLFGIVGFVVFLYVMSMLNPLGLGNMDHYDKDPYDVSRPIRRWPGTVLNNRSIGTNLNPYDKDPYDVSRPIRRRPAPTNGSISTALAANESTTGFLNISPTENWITTETTDEPTTQSVVNILHLTSFQPFNRSDPLNSIEYPNNPPVTLCVPEKMELAEYEDKRWYCNFCWQEVNNGTLSSLAQSEVEHRYKCHQYCFDNYEFQSCALHLFNTGASSAQALTRVSLLQEGDPRGPARSPPVKEASTFLN